MSVKNFTEEFKIEAAKQVTEQGYPVSEVSARLGVSTNRLSAIRSLSRSVSRTMPFNMK
ncbi:Transposase [Yersinia pseudotuberculosis]|nr:transposase family protein [Yersinia pseudotuberculosis]CND93859.1 Transposase [Yersinia pseudotuberculosis]CNI82318.1 Transposase [Yersinia pseudotuberculosis]CNJ16192.1 Transposase [Yersinia pseudotuberculosis]VEE73752.1 Transposase [Yersinia pseudotuberculosis]